jgi:hypothetical protein
MPQIFHEKIGVAPVLSSSLRTAVRETATMKVSNIRSHKGSGIVEGTVSLMLIVAILVGGILLLVNCGLASFYKEKLGFAANEIAHYAANLPTDEDPTADTQAFADDYSKAMNLPALELQIKRLKLKGEPAVKVTVTAKNLALVGAAAFMPKEIAMSETSVALRNSWKPDYLLTLSLRQNYGDSMVTVPCYGRYFADGRNTLGTAYVSFKHKGHFWMNFNEGGFTAQVGDDVFHRFGDGATSNNPGKF